MQLLHYFLHPLFFSLPLRDPPVVLLPLCLNCQSYFLHKCVCSKLAALFTLHAIDNISLSFVACQYVYLYCCWFSLGCCFANHYTTMLTHSLGLENVLVCIWYMFLVNDFVMF